MRWLSLYHDHWFFGISFEKHVKHRQHPQALGRDVLVFLMAEHNLKQSELPELGSRGVVSEILNGKRQLNLR